MGITDKQFSEAVERFPIMAQWGRKGVQELADILGADLEQALRESREEVERLLRRMGATEMKSHLQTIDERDDAEQSLSQAYFLVKGESPEWSNLFGYEQALEEIDDAQKCLRAEIKQLEATIAELSKPVTDEEWEDLCAGTPVGSRLAECFMSRRELDDWILSRQPKASQPEDRQ